MQVTFSNVTIHAQAETPRDAYRKLCGILYAAGYTFTTDTFDTHGEDGNRDSARNTNDLAFPL